MSSQQARPGAHAPAARAFAVAAAIAAALPWAAAGAQTDWYNTDAGRPLRVQDASVIERHVVELQAAPVHLERHSGGAYSWEIEPEVAWGILPYTQVEVGLPLVVQDGPLGARRTGLAGVHVSVLHSLNTETLGMPALALGASALLPAGPLAASSSYGTLTGVVTRTFGFGRMHLNGAATVGPTPAAPDALGAADLSRWEAGVAVDRAFPFRAMLVAAEVVARRPLAMEGAEDASHVEWSAGAGIRRQLDPRWLMDAGIARTLTGHEREWSLTVGAAYAFAIPALMGGR